MPGAVGVKVGWSGTAVLSGSGPDQEKVSPGPSVSDEFRPSSVTRVLIGTI
jgi:hypothetical protein